MKPFLCILCVLCGFPSARALDRQAFTFTDYDLRIKITPATQSFEAEGKVTLRNDTAQPERNPVLQISSTLNWKAITVAGKPAQFLAQPFTSDIDHTGALSEAILTLPQPVPPQGTVEIEVTYEGRILRDSTRLTDIGIPPESAAKSDWDEINDSFTGLRGIGYVAWYPIATEAAGLGEGNQVFQAAMAWRQRMNRTRMRVSLCWSGEGQLAANGQISTETSMQPGGQSCRTLQYDALGMAVPTFVIGSYRALNQPPVAIQYIAGHESYARAWATAGEKTAPFITQWFGQRQRPVQIVELPDRNMYPFEAGNAFFTPLVNAEEKDIQVLLAHQLAHASFQSPRPWMDEGLAHFAQALEREQQEGRKAALAYMDDRLSPLQEAEKEFVPPASGKAPDLLPRGQPLVAATDEIFYRTKAMFVWWMLRDMVGDDALERAIRAYRPDQDKEPSYFQRLLASQLHRDLEWFFDDWVYRDRGLPEFHITSVYPRKLIPEDWSVTVTVENSGSAGAEVLVTVQAAQGEERKRLEVRAREKDSVRIPIPVTPRQAVVNDGSVPAFDMNTNRAEIKTEPSPR